MIQKKMRGNKFKKTEMCSENYSSRLKQKKKKNNKINFLKNQIFFGGI